MLQLLAQRWRAGRRGTALIAVWVAIHATGTARAGCGCLPEGEDAIGELAARAARPSRLLERVWKEDLLEVPFYVQYPGYTHIPYSSYTTNNTRHRFTSGRGRTYCIDTLKRHMGYCRIVCLPCTHAPRTDTVQSHRGGWRPNRTETQDEPTGGATKTRRAEDPNVTRQRILWSTEYRPCSSVPSFGRYRTVL